MEAFAETYPKNKYLAIMIYTFIEIEEKMDLKDFILKS